MEALPFPVVRQRSGNDCMVASFATVIGRSYEEVAKLLDVTLDPVTNAVGPELEGVPFYRLAPAALRLGLSATTILCETPHIEQTGSGAFKGVPPQEFEKMVKGRDAVLCVAAMNDDRFVGHHAVAWKEGHVVDCANYLPPGTSFEDAGAYTAVILAPLPVLE